MKKIDIQNENDAYDEILSFFKRTDRTPLLTEIWTDHTYINLMNFLEENKIRPHKYKNYRLVKNAIILILSLFHDLPPDRFNSVGKDLEYIEKKEKLSALNTLREEFLD